MTLSLAGLLQPDQIDRALCLWYGPPEMAIRNDNKSLLLQLHCLVLHSAGTTELSQWENNNNKKAQTQKTKSSEIISRKDESD